LTRRKARSSGQTQSGGIGFEEAQEIFTRPYYLDARSDVPEQYRVIGWVGGRMLLLDFRDGPRFRRRILPTLGHALEIHASGKETL